jgi:ComF family protein
MLPQALNSLINLLYPQFCAICAARVGEYSLGIVCADCWAKSRPIARFKVRCGRCATPLTGVGRPFNREAEAVSPESVRCHRCDDHFYDRATAVAVYEHGIAATLINLKHEPFVPRRLQELMTTSFFDSGFGNADLIMPVPLSVSRARERGFNQAELLARTVARECGLPLDTRTLVRRRHQLVQRAILDRKARAATVAKAFEITRPKFIEGRDIVLIDDVLTSGATVSACAEALKTQGAERVFVFTAARAAL